MTQVCLFEESSVVDLVCRGWSRDRIKSVTGIDPGYNNASVKKKLSGVDRVQYKIEHVRHRIGSEAIQDVLHEYATGEIDKEGMLERLGLHDAINLIKLKVLFAELGLAEEFADADRQSRHTVMSRGMVAATGVDNPFKLAEIQEKAAVTREKKYGARYTLASGSVLADEARRKGDETQAPIRAAKRKATAERKQREREERRRLRMEMGYSRRKLSEVEKQVATEKRLVTSRVKYGVDHPSQRAEFREYVSKYMKDPQNQQRIRMNTEKTNLERYGVIHPTQLPEYRLAQSRRMSDSEYQRRLQNTKRKNNTFATSTPEQSFYRALKAYAADHGLTVCRQYRDEARYPFAVDFYIPERDLFIELNGSWTHGKHWFNAEDEKDQTKLAQWEKKAESSEYYGNAIYVWTDLDVRKREAAEAAGLNYVTFWDGSEKMLDARLWLALGCPDGKDWKREYTWLDLPQHLLDLRSGLEEETRVWADMDVLKARAKNLSLYARSFNWETFYARELGAWEEDATHPTRWGRTRARLLANRLFYVEKSPHQLFAREVVRGFGISGELRAFSTFDNKVMVRVLDRFDVRSVYDPCSGWGERMLTCAQRGIGYQGTDISKDSVRFHREMIEALGVENDISVELGDSADRDMRGGHHDAVITCPPYGNLEIYTESGAENLRDSEFLSWWSQVVDMSVGKDTRIFAFQINEPWREKMMDVALVALGEGWELVDEIDASTAESHFQRALKKKRRGETMVVLQRVD